MTPGRVAIFPCSRHRKQNSRFRGWRITITHLALGSAYEQESNFAQAIASLQEGNAAWRSGVVVACVLGDAKPFLRVIEKLPESLLGK